MAYSFANAQKAAQQRQQAAQSSTPTVQGYIPPMSGAAAGAAAGLPSYSGPTNYVSAQQASAAETPAQAAPTGGYIPPMSQAMQAEITRKANSGIALTNPNAQSQAMYDQVRNQTSSIAPNLNSSQLSYFDRVHGGVNDYATKQNERYAGAMATGNTDLANRLQADSQRVGYSLNPYIPQMTQQPSPQQVQPTFGANDMYQPRSSQDLWNQSGDFNAIERADLVNAGNTQKNTLQADAEYVNKLLQDSRILEDQNFARTNAPAAWDGSTGYRGAQLDRGRQIDDTYRAKELTNQLNSISQDLYNFDKLAPERQRTIYNQLLQMERQFGISVAQLMGSFGGQRTLQGAAQDWGQQIDLIDRYGQLPNALSTSASNDPNMMGMNMLQGLAGVRTMAGEQHDLLKKQANFDARNQYAELTGYIPNLQDDWSGFDRQNARGGLPMTAAQQNQQFNQGITMTELTGTLPNGQKTTAEQQRLLENEWMVAQQTGRITKTLADTYGIPEGAPTQAALQFAQQLAISQQNANTSADNSLRQWAELGLSNQPTSSKYTGMSPSQVMSSIKSNYMEPIMTTDQFGEQTKSGERVTTDANKRYQMFLDVINANLESDTVEDQVLLGLGMSKAEITKMEERARKEFGAGN